MANFDRSETKKVYAYNAEGLYQGEKILDYTDRSPVSGRWQIPAGCTVIPPDIQDGYNAYYINGSWENREIPKEPEPPEKTLEEVKNEKIMELKYARDTEEVEPVEYSGNFFDYDDKSRDRLQIARQALEDAGTGTITWTTADNLRVDLKVSDFAAINTAAAMRSNTLHIKYNELKTQVNDASTKEEVESVAWLEKES